MTFVMKRRLFRVTSSVEGVLGHWLFGQRKYWQTSSPTVAVPFFLLYSRLVLWLSVFAQELPC